MILDMSYMELQAFAFLSIMGANTIGVILGWQYYKRKRKRLV